MLDLSAAPALRVGISGEAIIQLYKERKANEDQEVDRMRTLRDHYNGDIVIPLPEMDKQEQAFTANIIANGLDQTAQRISSTLPTVWYPPVDNANDASRNRARTRTLATQGWWTYNDMSAKLRLRSRRLIGYASSPVSLTPDFKAGCAKWRLRDSMATYPSSLEDATDMTPDDCIFAYKKTRGWLKNNYPNTLMALDMSRQYGTQASSEDTFTVIEYQDAEVTVMLVMSLDSQLPSYKGLEFLELERVINRAGIPLVVTPGRFNLDKPRGQYDDLVGMNYAMAKLMAYELIFAGKSVFPEKYLESDPGQQAVFVSGPHAASSGMVNIIQNGKMREVNVSPGFAGTQMISNLERNMRVTGGIAPEMGGECVDTKTEILTDDGWKKYDQIAVGTKVLTLNHVTGLSEWQEIQKMNVYPNQVRTMIEMQGSRHSSLSTLNHRWPVITKDGKRKWKHSPELTSDDRIPIAAMCADLPKIATHSDALVELVAWFYTEGHRYPSGAKISQSTRVNPENVERIRSALTSLFGSSTTNWASLSGCGQGGIGHDGVPRWREKKKNKNDILEFALSAHAINVIEEFAPNKIPTYGFLNSLTQSQLELFIHVSMLADNCGSNKFGQKDVLRTEAFAYALLLSGKATSYHKRVKTEKRIGWREGEYTAHIATLRRGRVVKPKENFERGSSTFREIEYEGIVWCPTTANSSWYARREGSVYFTGNSQTNVRTGKRGDSIMSAVIDFPVQEAQEILQLSLQHENKRAVAIAKNYFGNEKKSFYITSKGSLKGKGHIDYTPNKDFESDNNIVSYPQTGVDANGLVVGGGQRVAMGTMSKKTFMEQDPAIDDYEAELEQIEIEQMRAAIMVGLTQQLTTGALPANDGARIAQLILNKVPLEEAITKAHEEAQARQATPAPANSPATQPGLSLPGMGAESPAIPQGPPSQQNLAQVLSQIKTNAGGA